MLLNNWLQYIGQKARAVQITDREALFELAATLYAVAAWFAEETAGLRLPSDRVPFHSIEEMVAALSTLDGVASPVDFPPPTDADALYGLLIKALILLDTELLTVVERRRRPRTFSLEGWPAHGSNPRVVAWMRPKGSKQTATWRHSRIRAFEISPRFTTLPPPAEYPDLHLPHHAFVSWTSAKVSVSPAQDAMGEPDFIIASGESAQRFRIALCPLLFDSSPYFEVPHPHRHFRASLSQPMLNPERLQTHLEEILNASDDAQVHLLVFPELAIDADSRVWLQARLDKRQKRWPYAVVAGSFHECVADSTVNRSRMFHRSGHLMFHDKRGEFSISRELIRHAPHRFADALALVQQLQNLPPHIYEGIEPGTKFKLVDTTLGRFAILICKDAICGRRPEFAHLVQLLRPDFLLLPSMTPETRIFRDFADSMEKYEVSTFFVNAASVCESGEILALVQLSHYESKEGPPTRVAWYRGENALWVWERHAKKGEPKEWKPTGALPSGFTWLLGADGKRLGLTVDLANWMPKG